jgi:hypothetical protein
MAGPARPRLASDRRDQSTRHRRSLPEQRPVDVSAHVRPAPKLRAYRKATVAAEKLHAVTVLGMTNSRRKDFFDLWVLLCELCSGTASFRWRGGGFMVSHARR